MKNAYAHIEKSLRTLLAAVLGITLCLPALPGKAFAEEGEEPFNPVGHIEGIAPARFEDAPAVGTVIDLGYGWVTGLRCEGESMETGHIYFQMDFDDTYDIFGGPVRMDGLACMDKYKAAAGGAYDGPDGRQSWPVHWLGRAWDTRFHATAKVFDVDYERCTITYDITALVVINNITDPGVTGYQRMSAMVDVPYTPGGHAELLKVSANPDCTAGNPMYSLVGAIYGLYASEDDAAADENRIFTFTTDETGRTNRTDWIDAGTYYVKEISASKGYQVDPDIHAVSVVGGVNTFEVKEVPESDPPAIWKVDADLNFDPTVEFDGTGNVPQGGATLAGAQFAVNYYAIEGTPTAAEVAALTPTRSWVVQTKANGFASVDAECYVSGDDLYFDNQGNATIPLGVVSFTEIKAPEGYLLPDNPPTYMVRITPEGPDYYDTGYTAVFVTDEVIKGRIHVAKTLASPDGHPDQSTLEGIQIQIISRATGASVATLTLDEFGEATSSLLPYGSYDLVELPETLPQGIQPYSWTSALAEGDIAFATIDITEPQTYEASFTDYTTTSITVTKTDADTKEKLPGAKFALYKVPASALTIVDGLVTLNPDAAWEWEFLSELTTGNTGTVGFSELPFGIYAVLETKAPANYLTETQMAGTDEPVLHVFTMDAAHGSVSFSVENKRVEISVEVHEYTIQETTAAFDGSINEGVESNVGKESVPYGISTKNNSSVDCTEYILTCPLTGLNDMGMRVTSLFTGTATGDKDGKATFWYTTSSNSEWTLWTEVDLANPQKLDVASLGLAEGEYLTAWQVRFGEVAADMHSGVEFGDAYNWRFLAVATRALTPDDGVLVNSCTVYTELKVDADTTIFDEDQDAVVTKLVKPVKVEKGSGGSYHGSIINGVPSTGDAAPLALIAVFALALASGALALIAARRRATEKEE